MPKPRSVVPTSSSSPGTETRVVGYSTTDPTTTFIQGVHTLKNGSYYKRNWATGNPYSSVPVWLDMDHVPPSQREFVVRPDLALVAMQRILGRIEQASQSPTAHTSGTRGLVARRPPLPACAEPTSPPCHRPFSAWLRVTPSNPFRARLLLLRRSWAS